MRWLVTGGAGFIGSHFMDYVRAQTDDFIVCYDILTYAADPLWAASADHLIVEDICDPHATRKALEELLPDYVVNFAAESHVDNSYRQTPAFTRTNVDGVVNLLESIRDVSPTSHFVQISTDEVYGDGNTEHTIDSPLNPQNPYAATKAAAEFMVNSFARSFGLRTMITRSSNNWGPRQHAEKFIPAALRAKATGEPMTVHNYQCKRDWLYVGDNVRAIFELTTKAGRGVWNIATGAQHNLSQVLDRIGAVPHQVSPERPGVDMQYCVSAQETWDYLGWGPQDFMTDSRWEGYVEGSSERSEDIWGVRA